MTDEIEIDLRETLLTLFRAWKWILAIAVLGGLIAAGVSLLLPQHYEATAVVAITRPRYIPNFDPRYETVDPSQTAYKAYLDLANSDDIIASLFKEYKDPKKATLKFEDFKGKVVEAAAGSDPSVIDLTVRAASADEAMRIANLWADTFTARANAVYAGQDPGQLVFFNAQLATSKDRLANAEQALVDFEARNQLPILNNQLGSLLARQAELLQKQRLAAQLASDARTLLQQLDGRAADARITYMDQMSFMALQLQFNTNNLIAAGPNTTTQVSQSTDGSTYVVQAPQSVAPPIQYQLTGPGPIDPLTVAAHKADVQGWIDAVQAQIDANQTASAELEDQIATLQRQIQVLQNEADRLKLDHQVAADTYTTLANKTQEVQITLQSSAGLAQVAGRAITPEEPVSRHGARNVVLAAAIAGVLATLGVLALSWWRQSGSADEGAG